MELKYGFMVFLGAVVVLLLAVCFLWADMSKRKYRGGIKAANFDLLTEEPYYKRQLHIYRVLKILIVCAVLASVMACFVLLARPYRLKKTKEEMYSRDIIFCLDVSTSVNELNLKLTKELQNTVRQLNGERIGIVIFNTSPILLTPLTDDYEYIIEQLDNIRTAIQATDGSGFDRYKNENWLYWYSYLMGGTLVGNEERGSSLIAEGLLGAVFNFPKSDKKRTRIVILSTDNDPNGESLVTMDEAADICKHNEVVVYGIGTRDMTQFNKEDMRACVEKTGGKFYLEESAATFDRIVEDIQSHSAELVVGKSFFKEIDDPEKTFYVLVCCYVLFLLLSVLLRRVEPWWFIRQVIFACILAGVFLMVVVPARYAKNDSGTNYKADSDLNVLFIVDDTLSMLARDYNGKAERLTAVKEDCSKIVDELYGARFSVIAFDNDAKIMAPFTNNAEHIKNVLASIVPPEEFYAKGTSINRVKDVALESLKAMVDDGKEKTAVFFVSDGEITAAENLESFGELASYIDGGAVLGYGTKQGGEMYVRDILEEDKEEPVMDYGVWPQKPALSVIDEKNLKHIADDLKIEYINMNSDGGHQWMKDNEYPVTGSSINHELALVLESLKLRMNTVLTEVEKADQSEADGDSYYEGLQNNPWYILLFPMLLMWFLETVIMIRKRG